MPIERRYSTRFAVELRVHILYRRRRFFNARARNLSEHGMYLDVHAVTLPTGTLIELEFECLGKEWLIPAIVVHHQAGGIGVMFRDPQAELYRGLIEKRLAQRPPAPSATTTERSTPCRR